jgi:hypothetical protein
MVPASITSCWLWMRSLHRACLLVVLAPLLTSCALFVNGLNQTIPARSTPSGAEVFIDGELRGVTPMELVVRRGDTVVVTVRLAGEQREVVLTSRANGGLVAVSAAPGVISGVATVITCAEPSGGMFDGLACSLGTLTTLLALSPLVVDGATSAWYQYDPSEIVVSFP